MITPIYLNSSSVLSAAGENIVQLLSALKEDHRASNKLSFASKWLYHNQAFLVSEPAQLKLDRKSQRTLEKLGRILLWVTSSMIDKNPLSPAIDKSRVGLFVGIPTIEEAVPSWEVVEDLIAQRTEDTSAFLLTHAEPFMGLSLLNSTVCAHIAGQLGIMGAMGAYSHFADAGAQAMIEGALSIAEGENDCAVIGGVSSCANVFLFLHYAALGLLDRHSNTPIPGEGAAALTLSRDNNSTNLDGILLSGYGRGFSVNEENSVESRVKVMQDALTMAQVEADQIEWIFFDSTAPEVNGENVEAQALSQLFNKPISELPLGGIERVTGTLGPATAITHACVAEFAMRRGFRSIVDQHGKFWREEASSCQHVLINSAGFQGQYASLVLSRANLSQES